MLDSSNIVKILLMNTIGEAILVETLRSAAYFVARSGNGFHPKHHSTKTQVHEARYCYLFVQGTGLDVLIQRYNLDFDPDVLRDEFNYLVRKAS